MDSNIGVILLDGNEVLLQIYMLDDKKQWVLFRHQSYDLASNIQDQPATSTQIIEIIADVLFTRYASTIADWKICARNMEDAVIHDISEATGFPTELLTLQREQELLCQGILMDME